MPADPVAPLPPVLVRKYGGCSLATVERIRTVAARPARRPRPRATQVVVVVSAMGNTTDELAELAHQATPAPPRRELDMLLSVGERITMSLLSMALAAEAARPSASPAASAASSPTPATPTPASSRSGATGCARPWPRLHGGGGRLPGRQPREGDHHPRPRRQRHHRRGPGRGPGRRALRDPQGRRRGHDRRPGPGAGGRRHEQLSWDEMRDLAASGCGVVHLRAVEYAAAAPGAAGGALQLPRRSRHHGRCGPGGGAGGADRCPCPHARPATGTCATGPW